MVTSSRGTTGIKYSQPNSLTGGGQTTSTGTASGTRSNSSAASTSSRGSGVAGGSSSSSPRSSATSSPTTSPSAAIQGGYDPKSYASLSLTEQAKLDFFYRNNPPLQSGVYSPSMSVGKAGGYSTTDLFKQPSLVDPYQPQASRPATLSEMKLATQLRQAANPAVSQSLYVVNNPYTGKQADLARQPNAVAAFQAAGYRPPVQLGELQLVRPREFLLKSEGALPAWGFKRKGWEPAGSIKVTERTVYAQNPTEARLAGLPGTGEWTLTSDDRIVLADGRRIPQNAPPRLSGVGKLSGKWNNRIEKGGETDAVTGPVYKLSHGLEDYGKEWRLWSEQVAAEHPLPTKKPENPLENIKLGGQAAYHNLAVGSAWGYGMVETLGADIRGRPIELGTVLATGALVKAGDAGLVAARGSKLLKGRGIAKVAWRSVIQGTRIGTATVLGGGFALSTGAELIQTGGRPEGLGRVTMRAVEDVGAFNLGARGAVGLARTYRANTVRTVASPPQLTIRNEVKLTESSSPLGDTTKHPGTSPLNLDVINVKPAAKRLAAAYDLGARRVESNAAAFSVPEAQTLRLKYVEQYAGVRGLVSKPRTVTLAQSSRGLQTKTVTVQGRVAQRLTQQPGGGKFDFFTIEKLERTSKPLQPTQRELVKPNVVEQTIKGTQVYDVNVRVDGNKYGGQLFENVSKAQITAARLVPDASKAFSALVVKPQGRPVKLTRAQSQPLKGQPVVQIGTEADAMRNEFALSRNVPITKAPPGEATTMAELASNGNLVDAQASITNPTPRIKDRGKLAIETPTRGAMAARELTSTLRSSQRGTGVLNPMPDTPAARVPRGARKLGTDVIISQRKAVDAKRVRKANLKLAERLGSQRAQYLAQSKAESQALELQAQEKALDKLVNQKPEAAATEQVTVPRLEAKPLAAARPAKAQGSKDTQPLRIPVAVRGAQGGPFTLQTGTTTPQLVRPVKAAGIGQGRQASPRPTSPFEAVRVELGVTPIQESPKVTPIQPHRHSSRSGQDQNQGLGEALGVGQQPNLDVTPITENKLDLRQRQEQRQDLRVAQARTPSLRQRGLLRVEVKPPVITTPKLPRRAGQLQGGGYNVLVRRKGKFSQINSQPLSGSEALALGKKRVKGTLAASFKVLTQGGQSIDARQAIGQLGKEFRTGKRDKTLLVQVPNARLGSRGERLEIRQARRRA